jgi:hypothetical protein
MLNWSLLLSLSQINVDTGGVVETGLDGNLSCSQTQHRVHNVYHDTDGWIW